MNNKLDEHEQALCQDQTDSPIPDCIVILVILVFIAALVFLPMTLFGGE